jgi:hypothetical protein
LLKELYVEALNIEQAWFYSRRYVGATF